MSSYSKKTSRRTISSNPIVVQHTSGNALGGMSLGGGGTTVTRQTMRKSFAGPMLPKGQVAARSRDTVNQVIADKTHEKEELGELNSKFAAMLEAQAINDAKKALLLEQVEALKKEKCPDINSMKDIFVDELEQQKKCIADLKAELAKKESELLKSADEIESKDAEIDNLKRRLKDMEEKLKSVTDRFCDIERELHLQQMNTEQMNGTIDSQAEEIARLKNELAATRSDLQHAREQQIILNGKLDAECDDHDMDVDNLEDMISKLKEEIETLKRCQPNAKAIYEQRFRDSLVKVKESCESAYNAKQAQLEAMYESRMSELQAAAARKPDQVDSGISREQNRELKSSLNRYKDDINRLQAEVDQWKRRCQDMEHECELHCGKYEDEIARLKNQLEDVNEDLQESELEIAHLKADVCTLQGEIGTYRNLLECGTQSLQSTLERSGGIQSRSGEALANIIGGSGGGSSSQSSNPGVSKPKSNTPAAGAPDNQPQRKPADKKPKQPDQKMTMSSSHGQVRLKKQSMGTVQITVVSTEGAFVELSNEKGNDLDLSGWSLERKNKGQKVNYEFPSNTKLEGHKKLRLYGAFFEDEMKMDQKSVTSDTKCEVLKKVNKWLTGTGTLTLNNPKGATQANVELTFT